MAMMGLNLPQSGQHQIKSDLAIDKCGLLDTHMGSHRHTHLHATVQRGVEPMWSQIHVHFVTEV